MVESERDTALVKAFLAATANMAQEDAATLVGVSQPTVSRWEVLAGAGKDVTVQKGTRAKIEDYLLHAKSEDFRAGVRAALGELRATLDDLESRLTRPAATVEDVALAQEAERLGEQGSERPQADQENGQAPAKPRRRKG